MSKSPLNVVDIGVEAGAVVSADGKTMEFTVAAVIPVEFAENFRQHLLAALRAHAEDCCDATRTVIDSHGDAAMPKAKHTAGGDA